MKLENIFTANELALIDSGDYKPGRAVLDAKLDLAMALEREACAKVCEARGVQFYSFSEVAGECYGLAKAIRARGNT